METCIPEIGTIKGPSLKELDDDNHPCLRPDGDNESHNFPQVELLAFCICQRWQIIKVIGPYGLRFMDLPDGTRAIQAVNIHGQVRIFTEA